MYHRPVSLLDQYLTKKRILGREWKRNSKIDEEREDDDGGMKVGQDFSEEDENDGIEYKTFFVAGAPTCSNNHNNAPFLIFNET